MLNIIIASGPVIVEENRVLLNKDKKDNFWKFCGGRVSDKEFTLQETAKRKVKEEMGIEVEILDDKPFFFYTEKETEGKKLSVVLVHFLSKRIGEVVPGEETISWRWIELNSLAEENLAPNIIPTLKHFGFKV